VHKQREAQAEGRRKGKHREWEVERKKKRGENRRTGEELKKKPGVGASI
jgi:hypothetical protein